MAKSELPENIKEQIRLSKALLQSKEELRKLDKDASAEAKAARVAEKNAVYEIQAILKNNAETAERVIKSKREYLEKLEIEGKQGDLIWKKAKKDLDVAKKRLNIAKVHGAEVKRQIGNVDKFEKVHAKLLKIDQERSKHAKTAIEISKEMGQSTDAIKDTNMGILDIFKKSAAVAGDLGAILTDIVRLAPQLGLADLLGVKLGTTQVSEALSTMTTDLHDGLAGMVKATGLSLDALSTLATDAMDPGEIISSNKALAAQLRAMGEDEQPFTELGITTKEASAATLELINNAAAYRIGAGETDRVTRLMTTNLVAGLSKIGVKQAQSVKMINLYTKAMKKTPLEANKAIKKLVGVSKAMGVSLDKAFGNFEKAAPVLSQFGDRMGEVFLNLQARAAATGAELTTLSTAAMKLDTFEGAAKAAQGLNAILGDTLISTTELVHADPDEKFAIIARAIKASGKELADFDRRVQGQMASFAGLGSVAELSAQIYNTDPINAATEATKANAATTDDMAKQIKEAQTITEKQTASLSAMTGGMMKALPELRTAADGISKSISKSYGQVKKETGSSLVAVLAVKTALEGTSEAVDDAIASVTGYAKKAVTLGTVIGGAFEGVKMLIQGPEEGPGDTSAVDKMKEATKGTSGTATADVKEGIIKMTTTLANLSEERAANPLEGATITLLDPNSVLLSYGDVEETSARVFDTTLQTATENV